MSSNNITKCYHEPCQWIGDIKEIFNHCEYNHSGYIREISREKRFTFTHHEVQSATLLLVGERGLYWFLKDSSQPANTVNRGVFHVGESEICDYTLQTGDINTDHFVHQVGPFKTLPIGTNKYEIEMPQDFLKYLRDDLKLENFQLIFGAIEEVNYRGGPEDVDWTDPEELAANEMCLERFTCYICYHYIRSNARFCPNKHFLCKECLDKWLNKYKKTKCPLCYEVFRYDCYDEEIEDLLRLVRFPA